MVLWYPLWLGFRIHRIPLWLGFRIHCIRIGVRKSTHKTLLQTEIMDRLTPENDLNINSVGVWLWLCDVGDSQLKGGFWLLMGCEKLVIRAKNWIWSSVEGVILSIQEQACMCSCHSNATAECPQVCLMGWYGWWLVNNWFSAETTNTHQFSSETSKE